MEDIKFENPTLTNLEIREQGESVKSNYVDFVRKGALFPVAFCIHSVKSQKTRGPTEAS